MLLIYFLGIIVTGCVNAMLVTVSKRYGFSNTQIAWLPATQDVVGAVVAIVVGYLGKVLCCYNGN